MKKKTGRKHTQRGLGRVGSELRARAQGRFHTVPRGLSRLQPREPPRRPGVMLQGDRDKGGKTSSPKRRRSSWRNKVAILKGLITQMIRQYRNQRKTRRKPHMTRPGVIFKKGHPAARNIHRGQGLVKADLGLHLSLLKIVLRPLSFFPRAV